jgi:hypothetical protein
MSFSFYEVTRRFSYSRNERRSGYRVVCHPPSTMMFSPLT